MEVWTDNPNKRSLAIVRHSGSGQKNNTSADTQENEIQEYCRKHGLELVVIEPIIETAFKSGLRKKYKELLNHALQNGIRHVLFYISNREARNLTDNEKNEELIREDRIVIHHVKEGKVFHKDSPDSEFLMRDINASINKHYSRENSTKMKAAYKTKAESGWWPYRHTPLGYVHQKDKDQYGNGIKGTAKVVPDLNRKNVEQVRAGY
jgi:DNA invertase Pin-like site-specific DNA recombinase